MVTLAGLLSQLQPVPVLVLGDLMLDTYTTGKVKRISPEAPVPVLHVQKQESRPGGAGNVVLNMLALGAEVRVVGRIGADPAGAFLQKLLESERACNPRLFTEEGVPTPVKNRLISDSQQLIRVDFEAPSTLSEPLEQEIISSLGEALQGVKMVALSDYGKGFLSRPLLEAVLTEARHRNIPVIVDPKGDDFSKYHGATIVKPNLAEAYAAAKLSKEASLEEVAAAIFRFCRCDYLLITRSEDGMTLFDREGHRHDFPVRVREVKDVTGAGDTVLATLSVALGSGLAIPYAVQLANTAAGIAIERVGCEQVSLSELAERLLERDLDNKIFDEEHLFALQKSLEGRPFSVLGLHNEEGITSHLFRAIKRITSDHPGEKLIVYLRDRDPDEELVSVLTSLAEVDFLVLKSESLRNLYHKLHPNKVYHLHQGLLLPLNHPADLLCTEAVIAKPEL